MFMWLGCLNQIIIGVEITYLYNFWLNFPKTVQFEVMVLKSWNIYLQLELVVPSSFKR